MNKDNLHELINRYEDHIDKICNAEHDELFKWKAMKTWRDEWFKPEGAFATFADRFWAARKDFSLFIDNSRMHPSSGVVKLWEKEPDAVERLFNEVLFADPHGDASAVQNNMDSFLEGYEKLRRKYYGGNWSYKQDRHSASVFLAMYDPDFNFVYKHNEAAAMAKYTEFGFDIGFGKSFSLKNYYLLCSEVAEALKEHGSLLEKHFGKLTPAHYNDSSLHLLAFDLMYCCRTYGYYKGLTVASTGKTVKRRSGKAAVSEETLKKEAERAAQIEEIERQIAELELRCDEFADISLIGVQVESEKYGPGIIVDQNLNTVKVRFEGLDRSFCIQNEQAALPRFEDHEQIVSAFSEYARIREQIRLLRLELSVLRW